MAAPVIISFLQLAFFFLVFLVGVDMFNLTLKCCEVYEFSTFFNIPKQIPTYRPPPCSNEPAFVSVSHTLLTFPTYRPPPCSNELAFVSVSHRLLTFLTYRPPPCSNGSIFVFMCHTLLTFPTYRPPSCSNEPAFISVCHILLTFSPIGLLHLVMSRPWSL